jgi:phage terminase large subunit-like protein
VSDGDLLDTARTVLSLTEHLSADDLAALPPERQEQAIALLEDFLKQSQKKDIRHFARAIEVPGTPLPSEKPRRSDAAKRAAGMTPAQIAAEAHGEEPKFYADKLAPAPHHDLILQVAQGLLDETLLAPDGEPIDGVMIFAPPGSAKSSYASVVVPAFALGYRRGTDVICASYAQELADRFSRRVRHVCGSPDYQAIFHAPLTEGNTAVRQWTMANGSSYRAAGIGAAVTGFRADLLVIDDPVAGREEADSEVIRDKTWNAYKDDLATRLKPRGKVLLILTRWHEDDMAGRILGETWRGQSGHWRGTDRKNWYIINMPMLAEHADDPLGRKAGELLWPQWFDPREIKRLADINDRTWVSLYQQRPAAADGVILMRANWRRWPDGKPSTAPALDPDKIKPPPECQFIFLCYDTALEDEQENDYSAMTAWGIFKHKELNAAGREFEHSHVMLLGAWQKRVKAVDLVDIVISHSDKFRPDMILIEKRASGHQLIQEMARRRYPVKAWLPPGPPGAKGKVPRAHGASFLLEQGSVWYYPGAMTQTVIDQSASFPFGQRDDLVDTVTMALIWLRNSWMVDLKSDELSEEERDERMIADNEARRRPRRLYG